MVPEPKHRAVSLWKTSLHGERIQGIFLGPGWEPLIFVSRAHICQGFSLLMCCFIIEMKATPYYESGLDVNSCTTVIIPGLGFFKKVLISLVSIAGWKQSAVREDWKA